MKTHLSGSKDGITLNAEVADIVSFDNLNYLADEIVAFSYNIDENIQRYKSSFDLSGLIYNVVVVTPHDEVSEYDLFKSFSTNKTLCSKAVNVIENVTRWARLNYASVWRDEQNHFAQDGALALCQSNSRYIPLYTDLLLQSDLDHEVHQADQIDKLINIYGYIPDTIRLLAYRGSDLASAQWGADQLEEHANSLRAALQRNEAHLELFLETSVRADCYSLVDQYFPNFSPYDFSQIEYISSFIDDNTKREEWLESTKKRLSRYS